MSARKGESLAEQLRRMEEIAAARDRVVEAAVRYEHRTTTANWDALIFAVRELNALTAQAKEGGDGE